MVYGTIRAISPSTLNHKYVIMSLKKVLSVILLFVVAIVATAQTSSMTDEQVVQYIKENSAMGVSQQQIAAELLRRGVSDKQLKRIRTAARTNTPHTNKDAVEDIRTREYNGEVLTEGNQEQYEPSKIYGHDIFRTKNLTFEPSMNIALPADYVLGPGDEVAVDISGAAQSSEKHVISPDGTIVLSMIGPINLSGLTASQAQARIRSVAGEHYQGSNIRLSVGQTRSIMVNVLGEVSVPGTYTLSAFSTVFNALYMAGGITDLGSVRTVKVSRNGIIISTVDIYDYIVNGRLSGNVMLHDGDAIIVPPYESLVEMQGCVKRPMIYELKKNESFSSLLQYAGGFASNAYTESARVVRRSGKEYSIHTVMEFDMTQFRMHDGDVVTVDSLLQRFNNMVEVYGAVFRPGKYELGSEINSVRSLVEHSGGLTESAFGARAVMHRMQPNRTREILSVDIAGILDMKTPDIPLRNEDVLYISSDNERLESRTLTIHGEVLKPGAYPYADSETVEDLILQAGGLMDAASVVKIDVSRRILDPAATEVSEKITETFTLSLKNGFVVSEDGFELKPFDEVYVRKSPGYNEQRNVSVQGEVLFRGTYPLENKNTRLTDVIKAAGGVTSYGYLKGATLERQLSEAERQRMRDIMDLQYSIIEDEEDSARIANMTDISRTVNIGIDLQSALDNPGGDDDILLREGDIITIPQLNNTVRISGEVMRSNTVSYKQGKKLRYYIEQAGGYTTRAQKSKTFVVYANGTMALAKKGKMEPGCEIVIPIKQKKQVNAQMATVGLSAATALSTITAVLVNAMK